MGPLGDSNRKLFERLNKQILNTSSAEGPGCRLQLTGCLTQAESPRALVVRDSKLVGIVTSANLLHALRCRRDEARAGQ